MRDKTVEIAGKKVVVQERRIGELKQLLIDLFPGSGGKLSKINPADLLEMEIEDLLSTKLPEWFPGLTAEDVDNAYMSEIEKLLEAFVDVNFFGLKRLIQPLMNLAQMGTEVQNVSPKKPVTLPRDGTTRKR